MKTIEQIKRLAEDFTTKDKGHYHYRGKECFVKGYVDGYIQCSEDRIDEKYTEKDLENAFNSGRGYGVPDNIKDFNSFINSLNKQD